MSTCFWYDNWLPAGPLSTQFPSQILTTAGLDLSTIVSHFISDGTWNFPASISSAIPELLALGAPNNSGNDKLIWAVSPSGSFSHKHTVALLSPSSPSVSWFNLVWRSPAIPRMKFIMWLAVQGRLPTLDRKSMARFDNVCALCNVNTESHSHLFFSCKYTSPIWTFFKEKCKISITALTWSEIALVFSIQWSSPSPWNLLKKLCLAALGSSGIPLLRITFLRTGIFRRLVAGHRHVHLIEDLKPLCFDRCKSQFTEFVSDPPLTAN
ncbi:uncharacterized protein LOC132305500 [Cornus florida]|uniref:uncharacterized protein LOC132305500 n=1 Tax=Cornus florida TaxID=4283 RepID=UPI00289CE8B7|nr:uncharacterized protein LOC132305500 [Cornus florida]